MESNRMATNNKVLIIGAFDRYNYGDLLFPLIIEKQLATYGRDFDAHYYGMVNSDLRALGGKPTADIRAFYQACDTPGSHTSIIVAGGEAVAVTWNSLLLALNGLFKRTHRFHGRVGKVIDLNAFARWVLGGKTELPFVFTTADFAHVNQVVFNSLGGSELNTTLFSRFPQLADRLRRVDYFAVRDRATEVALAAQDIPTQLFPDSAILMAKFFPREVLADRVSRAVATYVDKNRGQYVFFQAKDNHSRKKERLIASQLDQLTTHTCCSICFCPIGKALNHDDHIALQRIAPYLTTKPAIFDDVSIWDIMYLIANAKVYAGTSLHGAITAMSYAVPYVGIEVVKLNSYLKTWGIDGLNRAVPFSELCDQAQTAMQADPRALRLSADRQREQAELSFEAIQKRVLVE